MSEVLYRKYRAKTFSEIKGQDGVVSSIVYSLQNNRISHAYLFAGPRGTGKTSMARLLAKAVNQQDFAESGEIDPKSEVSRAIDEGKFLDLIEIDAASNRGIEEIRLLREKVNFSPVQGKYKVYIIDEVHMLTREAFNALLKTLEEPPAHAIFVLATTEPHKLPVTILSRVQRYNFALAGSEEIITKLNKIAKKEGVEVESGVMIAIYNHSGGSFRDAESLLEKIITMTGSSQQVTLDLVNDVLGILDTETINGFVRLFQQGDYRGLQKMLNSLKMKGIEVEQFLIQLISYLKKQISENGKNTYMPLLTGLIKVYKDIRFNSDAFLIFEVFLLELLISNEKSGVANYDAAFVSTSNGQHRSVKHENSQNPTQEKSAKNTPLFDKKKFITAVKDVSTSTWALIKLANIIIEDDKVLVVVATKELAKNIEIRKHKDVLQLVLRKIFSQRNINIEIAVAESAKNGKMNISKAKNTPDYNNYLVEQVL